MAMAFRVLERAHNNSEASCGMFLHCMPEYALANTYHGTYKDVISRVRWFQDAVPGYTALHLTSDDPSVVEQAVGAATLSGALVEYSFYPRITRWLAGRVPSGRLCVRAINLEPMQHLDNHGWWPKRGPVWVLYGMWRLMLQDIRCKRHASAILSINEWEDRVYWKRLPGRAKVQWLPYYCPDHLIPKYPLPYEQRRVIACMPTSQKNRKSWDLVNRFITLAEAFKAAGCTDEFVITGKVADWGLPASSAVTYTGFVDDLSEFLGRCRAVAMLSPLGYGFKTTIGDAMAAGAHVLAHPGLVRRSPAMVRPYLLGCDTQRADPALLLRVLDAPPRGTELHAELRQQNHSIMAAWFGETSHA